MSIDPTPRLTRVPDRTDDAETISHHPPQTPRFEPVPRPSIGQTKSGLFEDKWFHGIQPTTGGFVIPGLPRRHTFDLYVLSDAVFIRCESADARFEWKHYGPHTSARLTSWNFSHLAGTGSWSISVDPQSWRELHGVFEARNDVRNRTRLALRDFDAFPLHLEWFTSPLRSLDRTVFIALMSALHEHSTWRDRLEERERVQQLANDVRSSRMRSKKFPSGVRPAHAEVSGALRSLGFTHRIGGRPLPDDKITPCDQVIEEVRVHLAERPPIRPYVIPYRPLTISADQIEKVVRSEYYDVEPWPFEALSQH